MTTRTSSDPGLGCSIGLFALAGIILLIAGGILYSTGVVFYVWKRLPYSHAVWHVFVLGGSICHYFAVLRSFVTPRV